VTTLTDKEYDSMLEEIKRLKEQFQKAKAWNQLCEVQIKNLGSIVEDQEQLMSRAADALEFWINDWAATEDEYDAKAKSDSALITELRKAAE